MNDWWKLGLAGVAGAGLLAATGGAALPGLLGANGAAAGAGAGAAGAAGAGAATGAAASAAGTAATTGSVLGGEALTGSVLFPEGVGALGAEAGASAAPGVMAFTTPPVAGGAPLSGSLAGTAFDYGAPGMLADANAAAAAAAPPGLLAKAGGFAKTGMKAAGAYGSVNRAMGGEQAPQQAPMPRPIFQGEAPSIAGGMGAPARNNNAVLAAIARRRQRGY